MAAALPSGNLIVPVIKNADQLNLVGITKQVNDPRALTCWHHPFVNDCHLANNKSLNHTAFSCAYYATNAPILIAYLFKLFEISTSYASRN